jgi:hypothetical protein
MEYLRQTMSSTELSGIFSLPPTLRDKQVEVIILPMESVGYEKPKCQRRIGFMPGPELPESFFDPLPEEELEAWGL